MTEILSQDEIDQLLKSVASPDDRNRPKEEGVGPTRSNVYKQIKIYDFKRPDKFSKEQIRTISIMHEAFARMTTTTLSAMLRKIASVHVVSVDQLTYEEFIRSVPNPTILAAINMSPLKGSAVLEMDPSIGFGMIDRLFGGTGATTKITREMTEIEISVMENVAVQLLGNVRESWNQVVDLRPRLGQIETNPQFAQIVPPTEMVVLITFQVKIEEAEGMINFCVPYLTLESIIGKLSAQYWYSSIKNFDENPDTLKHLLTRLNDIEAELIVEVGHQSVSVKEILDMKIGDVIQLSDARAKDPLILSVEDRGKYYCRPGVVGKHVAVEVVGDVENEVGLNYNANEQEGAQAG